MSDKLCTYVRHDNGIREFIFEDSSNEAVDDYYDLLINNALPNWDKNTAWMSILDLSKSGLFDVGYAFERINGDAADFLEGKISRTILLVFEEFLAPSPGVKAYKLSDREKGITWLLEAKNIQEQLNGSATKNLRNSDMRGLDLQNQTFVNVDLTGADLSYSNLTNADLSGAFLHGTKFIGANLTDANFSLSILHATELSFADLTRADFLHASFKGVMMLKTQLEQARNLDKIRHSGDSMIDVNTYNKIKKLLPVEFLRGIGVEIESAYKSIFISHSHRNEEIALKLHDNLQGEGVHISIDVYLDDNEIELWHNIKRNIENQDCFLLLCSEYSLKSQYIKQEVKFAQSIGKKIIPIDLDNYLDFVELGDLSEIKELKFIKCTGWERSDQVIDKCVKKILEMLMVEIRSLLIYSNQKYRCPTINSI